MRKHGKSIVIIAFAAVGGLFWAAAMAGQNLPGTTQEESPFWGAIPLRGISLPARATQETEITSSTQLVPIESYFDADYGSLLYVTPSGQMAAMEYPAEFQIRNIAKGDMMESVKFSRYTGEAMRLEDLNWHPVSEDDDAEQLTGGLYDVTIVAGSEDSLVICRIDQISGRSWFMVDGRWREAKDTE